MVAFDKTEKAINTDKNMLNILPWGFTCAYRAAVVLPRLSSAYFAKAACLTFSKFKIYFNFLLISVGLFIKAGFSTVQLAPCRTL